MACGAVVVKFDSQFEEFYEPALKDGVHMVRVPATQDGVDEQQFMRDSGAWAWMHVFHFWGGGGGARTHMGMN